MHCVLCGDAAVPRLVTTDMTHRGMTFLIPDVPAEVCMGCGEPYFELAVIDELQAEAAARWRGLQAG